MIGEEIDRGDGIGGFIVFTWFCCLLGIIVFSWLAYLGLIEKEISLGGMYGLNISHYVGNQAIFHGYVFFTGAVACFATGFWYHRFKYLIWLVIGIIWAICVTILHFYVV